MQLCGGKYLYGSGYFDDYAVKGLSEEVVIAARR
jgi:hypothetical protein